MNHHANQGYFNLPDNVAHQNQYYDNVVNHEEFQQPYGNIQNTTETYSGWHYPGGYHGVENTYDSSAGTKYWENAGRQYIHDWDLDENLNAYGTATQHQDDSEQRYTADWGNAQQHTANTIKDGDDMHFNAYQIEDENEVLLNPEDPQNTPKKENPCLWCPAGLCRCIGQGCYDFFYGPPEAYAPVKTLLGFPFGLVVAFGLYNAVIEPLNLSEESRRLLGGLMVLGVSCGYALSVHMRCIVCLLLPTFFGKAGRSYVGTFAIAFLIAGPINNILLNGKEITRSLSCATELSANHSKAKWELKMKPLEDVMNQFQTEGLFMQKIVDKITREFQPMKKEVEEQQDTSIMAKNTAQVDQLSGGKRGNRLSRIEQQNKYSPTDSREKQTEQKFRQRIDLQCENVWNEGVLRCRQKFADLENRCLDALPLIGYLLCLPLKMTFFCELIKLIPGAFGMNCNSADVLQSGFGEMYVASEDMISGMDENFEINLQYKLVQSDQGLDLTTAEEIRKATMHEFEIRQKWMQWIMAILSRILAFTFLRVLYSAYTYNKKYLSDFTFDNIYITQYFEHIDKRRERQGKNCLTPLKKSERCALVYPWSPKIMKSEKQKLGKGTFMLIMRGLISGVIIYSDYLLYTVMDIIRRHSRVDYAQYGKHEVNVQVFGDGFMSNIVRMFVKSFDAKHSLDKVSTNFECLPQPSVLDTMYIIYIYVFYGLVWLLMLVEAYGLRLRRLVASFFYRKREKARIIYLYNDMYKKRKGYARHMRHDVRRKARNRTLSKKTGLLASIRQEFPVCCGWLRIFESAKQTCLVCNEPEKKKTFVKCETPDCPFGYCFECWRDLKFRCYACTPTESDDSDLTEEESETSGDEEI